MAMDVVPTSSDGPDPEDHRKAMRAMMGPHAVQQGIQQAIHMCWMIMPDEKRNPDAVAAEIHRIVERELASLKEDAEAFGMPGDSD